MNARDIMTPMPRTVNARETVEVAIEALRWLDARHLPVVDDDGVLVGMLSDRDLRSLMPPPGLSEDEVEERLRAAQIEPIEAVMNTSPISVEPEADLREVVEPMLEHRVGAIPVVDGDLHPIGIVSYIDILRATYAAR
ncbi:MAG: CBS domain-containing protein [Labilithrix sp.]|nr:CBS domain-containing protein [Labilithrix sp.]